MSDAADSYVEILNLIHRYPELVDAGDFAGVGELLRDATLTFEADDGSVIAEFSGSEQIAASYAMVKLHPDGTPRTRHVVTNPVVEFDGSGESATCRYYVTVFQQTDSFPLQAIWANRYEDSLRRVAGSWRIVRRRGFAHRPGDTTQHLMAATGLEAPA